MFQQENSGAGVARNLGIEVSTGSLIAFVDGDDYVGPLYIQHLYDNMKLYNSDISCSAYYRTDSNNQYYFFLYNVTKGSTIVKGPKEWSSHEIENPFNLFFLLSVCKLYRKKLFNKIRFPKVRFSEDMSTIWKLFMVSKNISVVFFDDYDYVIRSSSTTNTSNMGLVSRICTATYRDKEEQLPLYLISGFNFQHIRDEWGTYVFQAYKASTKGLVNQHPYLMLDSKFKLNLMKKYN